MKQFGIFLIIIFFCSMICGCGNPAKINGYTYDTYGIINEADKKNPDIEYHIIIGNLIWSLILAETIIAPIYFIGFSLFEPIGVKNKTAPKGTIYHNRIKEKL